MVYFQYLLKFLNLRIGVSPVDTNFVISITSEIHFGYLHETSYKINIKAYKDVKFAITVMHDSMFV